MALQLWDILTPPIKRGHKVIFLVEPFSDQGVSHIETSQLICSNQLTGFYMGETLVVKELNKPLASVYVPDCMGNSKIIVISFYCTQLLILKTFFSGSLFCCKYALLLRKANCDLTAICFY